MHHRLPWIVRLLAALGLIVVPALALAGPKEEAAALAGYDAMLKQRVDAAGFVDYASLARDRAALDAYVASLAGVNLNWGTPDERLALLINAYNAFTLQLIIDHYDGGKLESIRDLHGGQPWKQAVWRLGGRTVSLDQLEHELIRKGFPAEPRIHWAVVCAAYSCPPLRAEAYVGDRLDDQLDDQEHRVHADERFLRRDGAAIAVTPLYDWYGSDFGDPAAYVQEVLKLPTRPTLRFLDYDWKLNNQPR
jgi:hypothetical protein